MSKKTGFTIIEVMIVLTIISCLMLIVFLAVPALKGAQRDARRKNDVLLFYDAVKEYQRNNSSTNKNPFDAARTGDQVKFNAFVNGYLGSEFQRYDIVLKGHDSDHKIPYKEDQIIYFPGHFCPTSPTEAPDGSFDVPGHAVTGWGTHPQHAWVLLVSLERPGTYLCLDQGNIDLP